MAGRIAYIERKTNETDIKLELHIDGSGQTKIDTGIGFFDHMLNSFARHGFFDLKVLVKGDLYVDSHHTIEDTGIDGEGIFLCSFLWCRYESSPETIRWK